MWRFLRTACATFAMMATVMAAVGGQSSPSAATELTPAKESPTLPIRPNEVVRQTAAASVTLPDLDGGRHAVADWQDKVVVLNFWAAWCAPCQAEIRTFVSYQRQYANRGLQVVSIGIDDEQPLRNVQRTLGINYPVLVADPSRHFGLLRDWGNGSGVIPYTVILDRKGRVVYTHRGPLEREDLDEHVLPALE